MDFNQFNNGYNDYINDRRKTMIINQSDIVGTARSSDKLDRIDFKQKPFLQNDEIKIVLY